MNKMKSILLSISLMFAFALNAQETKRTNSKSQTKVQLFSSEERDNLQFWIHDQVDQMELSNKVRDEYTSIILYYVVKIARLDDKDQDLPKAEILSRFDVFIDKLNSESQLIFDEDQYKKHMEIFKELTRSYKNRLKKL